MGTRITPSDKYAALRERLIRETEVALYIGLYLPGRLSRIPTVAVGKDTFDTDFASAYWNHLLGEEGLSALAQRGGSHGPDT